MSNIITLVDGVKATAHCCEICGLTSLNYLDDKDFDKNEQLWFVGFDCVQQRNVEVCYHCQPYAHLDHINKSENNTHEDNR